MVNHRACGKDDIEQSRISSLPKVLETGLFTLLRSPLPVLLSACPIVSILSSPPVLDANLEDEGLCTVGSGLPGPWPLWFGEISNPFKEVDMLVGGDVPKSWDDVGECSGDGDLSCDVLRTKLSEHAAACGVSRLGNGSLISADSALTTSANETKLNRRISVGSEVP